MYIFYTEQLNNTLNTSICGVDSLYSSVQHRAASLLNPAGHCYSGPALSESLMIVEWKSKFHSTDQ